MNWLTSAPNVAWDDNRCQDTQDEKRHTPRSSQDLLSQHAASLDEHLSPKAEDDHVNRHNQSYGHQGNVKRQEGDEDILVESLRTPEPLFPFKSQDPQLAEQVVADKKRQHRDHAAQHQPVMVTPPLVPGLEPSNDE